MIRDVRNFGKERDKRRLQETIIELSNSLRKSGMTSVIYLPDVNMFTMTGTVLEELICAGLILSQLCERTGKEIDQILDEDFYNFILPECKRVLKEGKVV